MNTRKLLATITTLTTLGCLLLFVVIGIKLSQSQPAQAVLTNGANALDMIGQFDGESLTDPQPLFTKGNGNQDQPNRLGYASPSDAVMDTVHHRFFVADAGDARILIYNLNADNTFPDRVPDNVLGQADFAHYDAPANTASGLSSPRGLAYDSAGDRLFVSESVSRVKVFDTASITNGENAVHILGQTNFTSSGSANTATGMNSPQRLLYDATSSRLFVAQSGNHRVTVYDVASITDGEPAINVLGQADFTASASANTAAGMNNPRGLALDPATNRLFVSQTGNHRVTVYNLADGITDGEAAINVLGQATFTATSTGNTATGMNVPHDLEFDPATNRLFVTQTGNHRITAYDVAAITDGEPAINVLGQATLTGSSPVTSQTGLVSPLGLYLDTGNNRLFAVQDSSSRITVFDVASITDGEPAVDGLGQYNSAGTLADPQPSYTKSNAFNSPYHYGYNATQGVALDTVHHRLFVDDNGNNRILVYDLNADNALIDRIPDHVLGQPDFSSDTIATTQSIITIPRAIVYDPTNDRIFVAAAQRILVFDVASITDGEPAVHVLGQANFTTNTSALTQTGVGSPSGLAYDAIHQRLFVTEAANHRVTVYDTTTITDGEPAVNVLGQPNFTTNTFAATQTGLRSPTGAAYDATRNLLFVSDGSNNRIMIYDVASISDGEPAVNVLGQADFVTGTATTTQTSTRGPVALIYDDATQRLFVANSTASRVTVFDLSTISNGEAAINILGNTNYTLAFATVSQSSTSNPTGLAFNPENGQLWVGEGGGSRVLVFDASAAGMRITQSSGTTAVTEGGTTDSFDVVLTGQPATDVVITVTSDNPGAATVSAASLTFTTSNWNTPQTVTVSAPEDGNLVSETPVVTLAIDDAASDNAFDPLLDQTVNIAVTDNDVPGFTVVETAGTTAVTEEGTTDSFTVVLNAQPASDVVFDVTSDNPALVAVDAATLTFTDSNWDTPQTIAVNAPADPDTLGGTGTITIAVNDAASDDAWDALVDRMVSVSVTDNDAPAAAPLTVFTGGGGGGYGAPQSDSSTGNPAQPEPPIVVHTQDPQGVQIPTILDPVHSAPTPSPETQLNLEKVEQHCETTGFAEADNVTRGDFVLLLVRCLHLTTPPPLLAPFSDVSVNSSFAKALSVAKDRGIVSGYADGSFHPLQFITRAEALKILLTARFADADFSLLSSPFEDVSETDWFAKYVAFAFSRGFITGYLDAAGGALHLFGPANYVTYAEVAKMLVNILDL